MTEQLLAELFIGFWLCVCFFGGVKWFHKVVAGALMVIVPIGVPLAMLYLFVRFVKWAWTN